MRLEDSKPVGANGRKIVPIRFIDTLVVVMQCHDFYVEEKWSTVLVFLAWETVKIREYFWMAYYIDAVTRLEKLKTECSNFS